MTTEFNVIGEHRDDADHLLVIGDNGRFYDYSPGDERIAPVDVDEHWQIDAEVEDGEPLAEPAGEDER